MANRTEEDFIKDAMAAKAEGLSRFGVYASRDKNGQINASITADCPSAVFFVAMIAALEDYLKNAQGVPPKYRDAANAAREILNEASPADLLGERTEVGHS
jgi:hypothetical protein